MKKKMITALCALTLTLGTAVNCFAVETNPQTTQAYINVPATAIDFSVTEEIIFTGTADSADLVANDLEVINNSKIGVLTASIEVTGDNGWTVVADSTDFTRLGANAKKISIMVAGDHDMAALGLEFLLLCDIQYAVLADPDLHYICIRTLLL